MAIMILCIALFLLILFVYSACVVSGMCSREEEEYERKRKEGFFEKH